MTNITLNYNLEDLNIFTPELKGWRLYLFTVSSMATAIISLVTQITVYKSLKRIGPRHINQMIIPSQVSKINYFFLFKTVFKTVILQNSPTYIKQVLLNSLSQEISTTSWGFWKHAFWIPGVRPMFLKPKLHKESKNASKTINSSPPYKWFFQITFFDTKNHQKKLDGITSN